MPLTVRRDGFLRKQRSVSCRIALFKPRITDIRYIIHFYKRRVRHTHTHLNIFNILCMKSSAYLRYKTGFFINAAVLSRNHRYYTVFYHCVVNVLHPQYVPAIWFRFGGFPGICTYIPGIAVKFYAVEYCAVILGHCGKCRTRNIRCQHNKNVIYANDFF